MPTADTAAWVAERIRAARDACGWTQAELAERLSVTQTAISYWEAGKRTPGIDELLGLSATLGRDVTFFLPDERSRPTVRAVLRATTHRLDRQDLNDTLQSLLDEMEALPPLPMSIHVDATRPAAAAKEVLNQAGITTPPIDVEEIAARAGVRVVRRRFDDALSGMILEYEGGAAIAINDLQSEARQRFTIGHELGHHLLAHHDVFHIDLGPSAEHGTPPGYDWRHERAANEFAAELLMPAPLVHAAFAQTQSVTELAHNFGVSELAMGYRLANLELR
ncbi:MAG: XRE family transcriptional regulator [Solirubrobacteraceae bacterium]